jgi:hypothetical protein
VSAATIAPACAVLASSSSWLRCLVRSAGRRSGRMPHACGMAGAGAVPGLSSRQGEGSGGGQQGGRAGVASAEAPVASTSGELNLRPVDRAAAWWTAGPTEGAIVLEKAPDRHRGHGPQAGPPGADASTCVHEGGCRRTCGKGGRTKGEGERETGRHGTLVVAQQAAGWATSCLSQSDRPVSQHPGRV